MIREGEDSDIVPGSVWTGLGKARVRTVNSGYITFDTEECTQVWRTLRFREVYSPPYNARQVRSQFSVCIANLVTFHAFWSPSLKKFFGRSTSRPPEDSYSPARGSPALPADAVYVRTYDDRAKPAHFLEDLNDALCCLDHAAA